jgi:hypothetical protein
MGVDPRGDSCQWINLFANDGGEMAAKKIADFFAAISPPSFAKRFIYRVKDASVMKRGSCASHSWHY